MRILIACEFSGIVRDAFIARGHDAISCDLLPSERPGPHLQCDIIELLDYTMFHNWDLMIAHPPCTHLAVSGARWFKDKLPEQKLALEFVQRLMDADIPKICIENPVSIISSRIRKPDQIIQPWMFGEPFQKTTCLWLKNLPKLTPTKIMDVREQACWKMPPSKDRWKKRSVTYQGISDAMSYQWGMLV